MPARKNVAKESIETNFLLKFSNMADALIASIVETSDDQTSLSTSFAPLNIHNSKSSSEIENYFINYIDDQSIETAPPREPKESLRQLEITQLPEQIFTDENVRLEFECIFHEYDPDVIITYSRIFQRAYLTFSDPILAWQVRANMDQKKFHDKKIKVTFVLNNSSSIDYLKPPTHERVFMQSPPTTPPVGWIVKHEDPPEINLDLFLALAKLQPHEPLEILPKQGNRPAIIIHPCSDTSDDHDELDEVINPILDEFGHKKYSTIDEKRRAQILHDAIVIPGEFPVRQSAGDGDRLLS